MRKSELEASAITYLTDSIRSRIPAYAGGRLNGPPPSGSRTENLQSDAGSLGRQVDAILSRSIPALPQFNRQRLGTLRLISDAGIIGTSDLATINNAAKVDEVIRTIDSMKPRFANPVQAATIGHLSEYLQRHGQIPHWVSPSNSLRQLLLGIALISDYRKSTPPFTLVVISNTEIGITPTCVKLKSSSTR